MKRPSVLEQFKEHAIKVLTWVNKHRLACVSALAVAGIATDSPLLCIAAVAGCAAHYGLKYKEIKAPKPGDTLRSSWRPKSGATSAAQGPHSPKDGPR